MVSPITNQEEEGWEQDDDSRETENRNGDGDTRTSSARQWCYAVAIGQLISLSSACASAAQSSMSVQCHVNLPLSSAIVLYFMLAITFHCVLWRKKRVRGTTTRNRGFARVPSSIDSEPPSNEAPLQQSTQQNFATIARDEDEEGRTEQGEEITSAVIIQGEEGTLEIAKNGTEQFALPRLILALSRSCILRNSRSLIFAFVALIDVEANFLLLCAFRYASLTSVQLLASLSIASVMLSSRFLMRKSFSYLQIAGVLLCVTGAMLLIKSDWHTASTGTTTTTTGNSTESGNVYPQNERDDGGSGTDGDTDSKSSVAPFWGDFLAVSGALLFGFNDALSEYAIKNASTDEYLAMVGSFGACFGTIQFLLLDQDEEWHQWRNLLASEETPCSTGTWMGFFLWFVVAVFCFYVVAGYFLASNDATLMGLSLQTANVYVVLFSVTVQHVLPSSLFYVAAALVMGGIVLYERQAFHVG